MTIPATVSIATETTAMPVVTPKTRMTLEERHRFITQPACFKAEKWGFVLYEAPFYYYEEEGRLMAEQKVETLGEYWLP